MISAPVPPDEAPRLRAVKRYDMPGGMPQEAFGRIMQLTTDVLRVPMVSINFIDETHQLPRASLGVEQITLPREQSVCAWTILSPDVTVVPDLTSDVRFQGHPLALQGRGVRSYAGAPLITPDGQRIGSLCVADTEVKDLTERERGLLAGLAQLAMDELELRRREHDLQEAVRYARVLAAVSGLGDRELASAQMAGSVAGLLNQATVLDWVGVIELRDGELKPLSEWSSGALSAELLAATWRMASPEHGLLGESLKAQASLFVDDYASYSSSIRSLEGCGVGRAACLYLTDGSVGTPPGPKLLLAVRQAQPQPAVWTESERALFLAAGRSLKLALERQQRLMLMQQAAYTDALTGLRNRRGFDEDLRALDGQGEGYSVVMVDLDGMKTINDANGHAEGDLLLQSFARQLNRGLQDADRTYRLGGDEFALILSNRRGSPADGSPDRPVPDEPALAALGRSIRARVDRAVHWTRLLGFTAIGASHGWASVPRHAPTGPAALQLADQQMYRHKAERRGIQGQP